MKRRVVSTLAIVLSGILLGAPLAIAADLAQGRQVFEANCTACHLGAGNVVNRAKTLKMEDLSQYEMASLAAIQTQVKHGKRAMPAFLGKLTDVEIESVAAYVLDQAEQGWSRSHAGEAGK